MRLEERINTYGRYLRNKYGCRVFRVGITFRAACAHRLSSGGCIFCLPETFMVSSIVDDEDFINIGYRQLHELAPKVRNGVGEGDGLSLLAYFQDGLPNDTDVPELERMFIRTTDYPGVRGIIVSSRCDSIDEVFLSMLSKLPIDTYLELGLQSSHQSSLDLLNRHENINDIKSVLDLCSDYGIHVGVHLIIGIPNENESDILQTIDFVNSYPVIKEVKLHNLTVYKGTRLADYYSDKLDEIPDLDCYLHLLGRIIARLRKDIVVSRLFTSNVRGNNRAIKPFLGVKRNWLSRLSKHLEEQQIFQGINCPVR